MASSKNRAKTSHLAILKHEREAIKNPQAIFQTVSLGSRVNKKRSEGHLTREGCRAKGPWAMERRRSATRSIHNNCVALAIL